MTLIISGPPPPTGPNSFVFAYVSLEKCPHQRLVPLPPPTGNPGFTTVHRNWDTCIGLGRTLLYQVLLVTSFYSLNSPPPLPSKTKRPIPFLQFQGRNQPVTMSAVSANIDEDWMYPTRPHGDSTIGLIVNAFFTALSFIVALVALPFLLPISLMFRLVMYVYYFHSLQQITVDIISIMINLGRGYHLKIIFAEAIKSTFCY